MSIGTPQSRYLTAADVPVSALSNDSLIIRLFNTANHLSRWLTPVHDRELLERSKIYGKPSVKELLFQLRDEEIRVFPKMYMIAVETNPDLDRIPPAERSEADLRWDENTSALSTMAEFRRLRHSTLSLLRSMPDSGWKRTGTSRKEHDWMIRDLAEVLANHDTIVLKQIDDTLDEIGAREGLSPAARTHLDDLMRLVPVTLR
jgi:hypothetical protein